MVLGGKRLARESMMNWQVITVAVCWDRILALVPVPSERARAKEMIWERSFCVYSA